MSEIKQEQEENKKKKWLLLLLLLLLLIILIAGSAIFLRDRGESEAVDNNENEILVSDSSNKSDYTDVADTTNSQDDNNDESSKIGMAGNVAKNNNNNNTNQNIDTNTNNNNENANQDATLDSDNENVNEDANNTTDNNNNNTSNNDNTDNDSSNIDSDKNNDTNNGDNDNTNNKDESKDESKDENKDKEQTKVEAPKIEGIEDGKVYNEPIIADISSDVDIEAVLKDDKGNETEYNSGDVINKDGKYTLTVTDSEGNVTEIEFTLDQTNPVVTNVPNITNQTVTPNVEDLTQTTATLNGEEYIIGTPIDEEGKYILIVTDEAGNSSTVEFEIDKTSPEALSLTKTPDTMTNKNVTITIEISEPVTTKAAGWIVSENGKTLTKTFSENSTGSISFVDLAGNVGNKEYAVENIDKDAPKLVKMNGNANITLEYGEAYIEKGVEVEDNSFEGRKTIKNCTIYYEGNKVSTVDTTKPGTYKLIYSYVDEAGNKSQNTMDRIVIVKEKINVSNITINASTTTLNPGDTIKCEAVVTPTDAKDKNVIWSSSNNSIVTVDENGNITAIAVGTATITATATDGSGVTGSIEIKVEEKVIDSTGIKLNVDKLDLKEGDTSKIEATIEPESATNKNVTFESSNTSVVTVDENGNVTAVNEGTTTIIVKSGDGKITETIPVTVSRILVSNITVNSNKTILNPSQTVQCEAVVTPTNAKIKDVAWSSSDNSIVTVDENGNVTAVKSGTATITATATDGSEVTGNIEIKVVDKPVIKNNPQVTATLNSIYWDANTKTNTFKLKLEIPSDFATNATQYIVRIQSQKSSTTFDTTEKNVTNGVVEFTIGQVLEDGATETCDYTITIIAMNEGEGVSQVSTVQKICTGMGSPVTPNWGGAIGFGNTAVVHSKKIKF